MICLHDKTVITPDTPRLAALDREIINPIVSQELSGNYTLSFDYPATGRHASLLHLDAIISTPAMPSSLEADMQLFRITSLDWDSPGKVSVGCRHVFFDLSSMLIADTNIVNKSAPSAIRQALSAAKETRFTVTGASSGVASARLVRLSMAEFLLGDDDNGLISRWGVELFRNNYHISVHRRVGTDRGVELRTGKNITAIKQTSDLTGVVTRILPVGYDGLTLPEVFVDSPRIGEFSQPRCALMRFEDIKAIKENDDGTPATHQSEDALPKAEAVEKLRQAAKAQFTAGVDQVRASWEIDVVDLARTREYHQLGYSRLAELSLGDTVHVTAPKLGLTTSARLVGYTYNPLTDTYERLTIGTTTPSFTKNSTSSAKAVESRVDALSDAVWFQIDALGGALDSADGTHRNHYGTTQPADPQVGDIWFKDNGEKTEIWIYQTRGTTMSWYPVAAPVISDAIDTELETIRGEVAGAVKTAEQIEANLAGYVSKTGVVAAINVSAESGKISPTRTHLGSSSTIDPSTIGEKTLATGAVSTRVIANLAVTDAKIAGLSAAKITTGYLAAGRIGAGSITSDKLTIANGFIKTAMIADAAITNAKIGSVDAGKITTGILSAARIGAGAITADKLASNAIEVGLAGWNQSIRINPYEIAWFNSGVREGALSSSGMEFYYGSRHVGNIGTSFKHGEQSVRGISMQLDAQGDFVTWSYRTNTSDDSYTTMLTLDPKARFYTTPGIHLGADLRTGSNPIYGASRYVKIIDNTLDSKGPYAAITSNTGLSKVTFGRYDLFLVSNGYYYNTTRITERISELINTVNSLISLLDHGWITNITDKGNGALSWNYYSSTGLARISNDLTSGL